MSLSDLLSKTATSLDRLHVPFMLTGSLASSLQGEPRATHDIDLVVDMTINSIDAILDEFPAPEYYVSRDAMEMAVRQKGMFNVLDLREGDKVDFWILTEDPFDRSRFQRRQRFEVDGVSLEVSSPEDTILMKLKWARDGGMSERQYRDALRVFELQRDRLDIAYIERWTVILGLTPDWNRIVSEARPID